MQGLILKDNIDLILDGKKTYELRGSNTLKRGKVYLVNLQASLIVGECNIIDSKKLNSRDFEKTKDKHCENTIFSYIPYSNVYAWELANTERYTNPIPYVHTQGKAVWVDID